MKAPARRRRGPPESAPGAAAMFAHRAADRLGDQHRAVAEHLRGHGRRRFDGQSEVTPDRLGDHPDGSLPALSCFVAAVELGHGDPCSAGQLSDEAMRRGLTAALPAPWFIGRQVVAAGRRHRGDRRIAGQGRRRWRVYERRVAGDDLASVDQTGAAARLMGERGAGASPIGGGRVFEVLPSRLAGGRFGQQQHGRDVMARHDHRRRVGPGRNRAARPHQGEGGRIAQAGR